MSDRIRVNDKIKTFVQKRAREKGLTEGEIIELELFGRLSKKR